MTYKCQFISQSNFISQCDFKSRNVTLYLTIATFFHSWLYPAMWPCIWKCDFISHNCGLAYLAMAALFLVTDFSLSQCDFIAQNATLNLKIWLYILWHYTLRWQLSHNCDFICCNVTLYLKMWYFISKYDFISHNVTLYIAVATSFLVPVTLYHANFYLKMWFYI